jgi:flagellar motility protein MotE (MotC chaperone)
MRRAGSRCAAPRRRWALGIVAAAVLSAPAAGQEGWNAVVNRSGAARPTAAREEPAGPAFNSPFWRRAEGRRGAQTAPGQAAKASKADAQSGGEAKAGAVTGALPLQDPSGTRPAAPSGEAHQYCVSIADAAADARVAWQKRSIEEMEQELERRIARLEEKTSEHREWLARRDAFAKKAQDTLLSIYTRMKAEASAAQLAVMDEETAAAILFKLDPKYASAILSEIPAAKAARLAAAISGAGKTHAGEHPAAVPAAAPQPAAAPAASEQDDRS